MDQTFAIWILIGLGLVTANLPFLVERHLLLLPWAQAGEPAQAPWRRLARAVVFFAVLVGAAWVINQFIGGTLFMLSSAPSVPLYLVQVLVAIVLLGAILWVPGRVYGGQAVDKPVFERLLEVLVFYALVGSLGFAFEASIGNPFTQGWEFYAVTLCLFVVLGYPGFVYRYLMRRRKAQQTA
jgi:hypothetical protein